MKGKLLADEHQRRTTYHVHEAGQVAGHAKLYDNQGIVPSVSMDHDADVLRVTHS